MTGRKPFTVPERICHRLQGWINKYGCPWRVSETEYSMDVSPDIKCGPYRLHGLKGRCGLRSWSMDTQTQVGGSDKIINGLRKCLDFLREKIMLQKL